MGILEEVRKTLTEEGKKRFIGWVNKLKPLYNEISKNMEEYKKIVHIPYDNYQDPKAIALEPVIKNQIKEYGNLCKDIDDIVFNLYSVHFEYAFGFGSIEEQFQNMQTNFGIIERKFEGKADISLFNESGALSEEVSKRMNEVDGSRLFCYYEDVRDVFFDDELNYVKKELLRSKEICEKNVNDSYSARGLVYINIALDKIKELETMEKNSNGKPKAGDSISFVTDTKGLQTGKAGRSFSTQEKD